MANVKFLQGTNAGYAALAAKDANTFYYTKDDNNLYLGTIKLSNAADVQAALDKIGDLSSLSTTEKNNLVAAINEVYNMASDVSTAAKITIDTTSISEGYLKSYTVKQGTETIGVIDIPKDLVVTEGSVVTNPEGQPEGTYIKLVIANQEEPIYINVKDLIDIYTAAASATQVQLVISDTNEISATIVAGSITATELAADAVITAKIADKNVTKAKLDDGVQASLDKADSAVQAADIEEGSTNGTISVKGAEVNVHGLDTAAYAKVEDFDAAGAATTAETNAKAYADELLTWGQFPAAE